SHNRIGTDGNSVDDVGERNIISGNGRDGIDMIGGGTDENVVAGNFIGTDPTGTRALGNTAFGGAPTQGAAFNWIGGHPQGGTAFAEEGNVISGNGLAPATLFQGVSIYRAGSNVIAGNKIGTDITGTRALGNLGGGVSIFAYSGSTASNTIGG